MKISNLSFSILTNKEVVSLAEVNIYDERIYNRETHEIVKYGPLDLRMGTGTKTNICETCQKGEVECIGHFGFIRLGLPIYNIGYLPKIVNLLQCVCLKCSRVKLPKEMRGAFFKKSKTNNKSLYLKSLNVECKKTKKCEFCKAVCPAVRKMTGFPAKIVIMLDKDTDSSEGEDEYDFLISYEDNGVNEKFLNSKTAVKPKSKEITPLMAYEVLRKITDEDVLLMGMNPKTVHPKEIITTHLIVPPVCIRPTVPLGFSGTNEDDLTIKIQEMVRFSNIIKRGIQEGLEISKVAENWFMLQSLHAQYLNSNAPGLPINLTSKGGIRALYQRLKGKQGRFRGNLSGKRVNFSGRTVISPDPNVEIDEVVVPLLMAKTLTFPETVTKYNIHKMRKLIINGPDKYPGANYHQSAKTKSKTILSFGNRKKIAEELQIGDIVERHLLNNDPILFNRQPSLHRLSIMCHKAKVMDNPWNTLRFNECVCTPYNADFDGDEMNVHVPQTINAKAEALTLMLVPNNLITPKNGEPIIALTQDFLTSSFLLTQRDMFFDRARFCQICAYFSNANEQIDIPPPTIIKPIELWTGKQIITTLLRPNRFSKIIINISLKERNYSGKNEFMCAQDGWVLVKNSELISGNMGKSTLGSGSKAGLFFSIIKDNSPEMAAKVMGRFAKLSARWIDNYGMTISAEDVSANSELIQLNNQIMEEGYNRCQVQILDFKNNTLVLKAGCNAEQTLESNVNGILSKIRDEVGEACRKTLKKSNPPLIMFTCGSKGSSINLSQMIACVGQQVVSGQRVPDGFTQRSLPHFEMNSKHPAAKGFAKNSFYTGLTATEFFFHTMGGREGLVDTAVKTAETGYMQALEDLKIGYDYSVRNSTNDIIQFFYGADGLDPAQMESQGKPVDFDRLLSYCQTKKPRKKLEKGLSSNQIIEKVKEHLNNVQIIEKKIVQESFFDELLQFFQEKAEKFEKLKEKTFFENYEENSKIVDKIDHITLSQLDLFFAMVWKKYSKAMIIPGEAVGAVTSQSIGEPGTQMTLKTFHFAGVASMNITLGVPRIKEIINATACISTPIITAKLLNEKDPISARLVKGMIEKTILVDICESIEEVFSNSGCQLRIILSQKSIEALKLNLSAEKIKQAIIKTPKIKLKDDSIKIKNDFEFSIDPMNAQGESLYFALLQLKQKIKNVIVQGISTVSRAVIEKQSNGELFNILVEGYGLKEVMRIPGVNPNKSVSNHVMEMEKTLGIEAGRVSIFNEIKYIMKMHGLDVDLRHISLLAEIMTFKGMILGINRFGISKMKDSALKLASFENTTDILFDAAFANKLDVLAGVSESIIIGKTAPLGSGSFDLIWNCSQERKNEKKPETFAFNKI